MPPSSPRAWLAEGIGTFALVLIGTGAIVANDVSGGLVTHVGVALAFGGVVAAMIYAVGDVSGAHLNPAVTIAAWLARRSPARDVAPFVAAQVAGALAASVLVRALAADHATLGATEPLAGPGASFAIEVAITFLLVFVILGVTRRPDATPSVAGLAIGGTVFLCALVAGPFCGASMNPARSLAPALVAGRLAGLWIYLLAPVAGGVLAVGGCRAVRGPGCCS
ncbi:MAG: aquaporin [Myxococcales bacterium]|nr:aquaporin [Myxococcales bacterium]